MSSMLLPMLARAGCQATSGMGWSVLQHQQVPGIVALLRSFTSNSTKEAVERAVVVDTLAQVRPLCTGDQKKCRVPATGRQLSCSR